MSDQAVSLVLGRNRDPADSRVHRIGKGKIDDARFPAEIDRRLGAPVGQLQKPASAPPPARTNARAWRESGSFMTVAISSSREPQGMSLETFSCPEGGSRAPGPIVAGRT